MERVSSAQGLPFRVFANVSQAFLSIDDQSEGGAQRRIEKALRSLPPTLVRARVLDPFKSQ